MVGDKAKQHKGRSRLENSELFFVFFSFSDVFRDAEVIKKRMHRRIFYTHCIAMHTTVREELVEAAEMSAVDLDNIVGKYCGTFESPRTTYVIAGYVGYDQQEQWFVGEGVCFSL